MARCELRGNVSAAAARRLLPFLLVKRAQALIFLDAIHRRPTRHGRTLPTEHGHEQVQRLASALSAIQTGAWKAAPPLSQVCTVATGYELLTPTHLGWTRAETLAYLAGIMDSDGNFRISRRNVREMRWPQYRINVRCAQVAPSPAVDLLKATFGGQISILTDHRPTHRDLVAWNVHDRGAVPALEALLPYLRVKWRDALLLLELRVLKSARKEELTTWIHGNRWHSELKMRKRSYSSRQVAEFEQVRMTLIELHRQAVDCTSTVPAAPG